MNQPARPRLPLAVAAGAKLRDVARESRRVRPVVVLGRVMIVTIEAGRRVRVARRRQLSVHARSVVRDLHGVADRAVDVRCHGRAARPEEQRRRDVGVALGTPRLTVRRGVVGRLVDVKRHRSGVPLHRELRIGVAAEAVLVRRAGTVEHPADLVRRMAIHTHRYLVRFRLPQSALNHLPVHVLDQRMTFRAGPHHVALVDAGTRVGVRQDEVRRMTRRANRSDR